MTTQNYLIIENNVVTNNVFWDGDVNTWQPSAEAIMIIASTTPAMIWTAEIVDKKIVDYVLTEVAGAGDIGFTWNGVSCVTNKSKPEIPTT